MGVEEGESLVAESAAGADDWVCAGRLVEGGGGCGGEVGEDERAEFRGKG